MKNRIASLTLIALFAASAFAQSNRTFVSAGTGIDSNPCSRTSPCRSFNAALAVTNAGGEVIALDSGGYGVFTILHSVSVESPKGVYAGITVSTVSGTGITINAGASDVIRLAGLTLVSAATGTDGIRFQIGSHLTVQDCVVTGFSTGINLSQPAELAIRNSYFAGNQYGVMASSVSGTARATVEACAFIENETGVATYDGGLMLLRNSVVEGSSAHGAFATSSGTSNSQLVIDHCQFAHNQNAAAADGSGSAFGTLYISFSAVSGCPSTGYGLEQLSGLGVVRSRGNNTFAANIHDTLGTIGSFPAH